jgi:hypothetical protein
MAFPTLIYSSWVAKASEQAILLANAAEREFEKEWVK